MNAPNSLIRYDAMVYAIAECHKVDEIKPIIDRAAQLAAAAKVAKDTSAIQMVTEIRVRAERKLGQILEEQPKANGGEHGGKARIDGSRSEPSIKTPTLAQLGIDKKLSSRAQKLAKVTDKQFEEAVAVAREVAGEVTAAAVIQRQDRPAPHPADTARVVIPASRAKDNETRIFELFGALETIATFPIPAESVHGEVRPYQRHRITNHLDGAIDFLTALRARWEN